MKLPRRRFLHLAASAAALPALSRIASAQTTYPSRPVRLVVGFPAGGAADISARLIGQWLSERLGQQYIVDNRAGASGNIATEAVVRAPSDGYTLLLATAPNAMNAAFDDKLNFNFIRDIAPVAGIIRTPLVMEVNPSVPAKTVPEFIALAKSNPDQINFASGGNGTISHVGGELYPVHVIYPDSSMSRGIFRIMAGVNLTHVPYPEVGPAVTGLLDGQVQVMFNAIPTSIEQIKLGPAGCARLP
jgi:tripartite-type tricarboxylate transporter receptor subunit TctC